MKKISIAIDGPSGAGKSTVAKALAEEFNIMHLDTGALFRALAYTALKLNLNPKDEKSIACLLNQVDMRIVFEDKEQKVLINDEDVTPYLRSEEVSIAASDISVHPNLRNYVLEKERELSEQESFVLDGRDIGTVVLPDADVKIFLTASARDRARRRLKDLRKVNPDIDLKQVLKDIEQRDAQDKNRSIAPTKQAEDAVFIDSSDLSLEETILHIKEIILGILCNE
ncbi:MAG TPA: (d)CMP kinase [Candidatus Eisenbacteria bacterium]|nr:(d)CMP kinase [Candidatus Eisenbacteria bacterium]